MPLETEKAQGQQQPLYTPAGPPPIIFEDFSGGLNTNSTRPGIKDNELWWSDGFFPIAANYLRTIPDVGPPIYDPNAGGGGGGGVTALLWVAGASCEILGFSLNARGNDAPVIDLEGSLTNLTGPFGNSASLTYSVARDKNGLVYGYGGYNTVDLFTWANAVNVYANGASGNVAPLYTISGTNTGFPTDENDGGGICVDASSNIYVGAGFNLVKFVAGNGGNRTPDQTIATVSQQIIVSCFFDATNQWIWILTLSQDFASVDNAVQAYDLSGTQHVNLHGSSTTLNFPSVNSQVYLDSSRQIYVCGQDGNTSLGRILIFASGASGNTAPIVTINDSDATVQNFVGMALDSNSNVYASTLRRGGDRIDVFSSGSSGVTTPAGVMTNSRLTTLADGSLTVPSQLFVG